MKKLISTTLAIGITVTSLTAPSYAVSFKDLNNHWAKSSVEYLIANGIASGFSDGTFKPNKTISNGEFMSMVLKAMKVTVDKPKEGEKWDAPIMRKALEIGIVKTGEPMTNSSQNITREQTATVLYRVLMQKEKLEPYWGQYDYPLERRVTDFSKISKEHLAGIATMFQQGIMNGVDKGMKGNWAVRYINPTENLTRAEMSVVMAKILDVKRRTSVDVINKQKAVWGVDFSNPKLSNSYVTLPFENGKPVVDKAYVIKQLDKTPYSSGSTFLDRSTKWDDYVNMKWALGDDLEYKISRAQLHYDTSIKALEKLYNVSYKDDLKQYEKDLRYYLPTTENKDNFTKEHLKQIKDHKLSIEAFVVSDKSLFYRSTFGDKRVKMRLFFKYSSPTSKALNIYSVPFDWASDEIKIQTGQWYQVDMEYSTGILGGQGGWYQRWENAIENDKFVIDRHYKLSDIIPIKIK